MKRLIYALVLCVTLFFGSQQRASAQFATFDASNLAQSILGFLQDGDNMVINTEQFLQNLGVASQAGVVKRHLCGGNRVLCKASHFAGGLRVHVFVGFKVLNFAAVLDVAG